MAARTWICQRQAGGVKCRHVNPKRRQICAACGKRRPPSKRPAHRKALDLPYDVYMMVNGGSEDCGICGRPPRGGGRGRRAHRNKTYGGGGGFLLWGGHFLV